MSKNIKIRIQNKHDIEANWLTIADTFIPLSGEFIIYDAEVTPDGNALQLPAGRTTPYNYSRLKIGDGATTLGMLPFILEDYATKSELPDVSNFITEIPAEYITNDELDNRGYLTQHQSLAGLATESYVDTKIAAIPDTDLSEYAKKSELPDVSSFINEIPAEYVTESELEAKKYLTQHQSLAGYATEDFVTTKIAEAKLDVGDDEPVDLSGYATKEDIAGFISEIQAEYVTETALSSKGYLTEQSLTGLAAESYVNTAVATHNSAAETHNDIRLLITNLAARLNTVANSDEVDLDQLREIVAYIKNNKNLIDQITTNKVNVSDIIDNLTTVTADAPLSAKQGTVLKTSIDALQTAVNSKADGDHTHSYAGSYTVGGAATSANKLNTNAGSETNPIYFDNGIPVKTKYTIEASVPVDAKFTDTVYTHPNYASKPSGLYKVAVDGTGHISSVAAVEKADIIALGIPAQDTNTTYSAGTGIYLSGTVFSNAGVRGITTGSTNGTISVNTNGTSTDVAVKGLGSAAYTASTAYDAAGAADAALVAAKAYTDTELNNLISCGTIDPSDSTTGRFYFKYALE